MEKNNMEDLPVRHGGPGMLGFTFLIFMTLKLTNVIDWSWWWVAAPLWIPSSIIICIAIIIIVYKELS
jgi:hypothetical protein